MPTNLSQTAHRRQQYLVPKELFPRKITYADSSGSNRRPVKLPLRKHHSFHFQSSQTVAGVLQNEQYHPKNKITTHERYKVQGPLVYKPFSEKSAFKPIVPSSKESNDSDDGNETNYAMPSMPRICGTSLKRHISNVETFSSNCWQTHDDAEPSTSSRRKIHYADLAPLPPSTPHLASNRNDRNNNSNSKDGRVVRKLESTAKPDSVQLTASAKSTQYATLRFDEANI